MVKLIGTAANQVPVNGMLGNMAYQNKEGAFIDLLGLAAGTAAAPSLIPSGDPNTGVWFPAADTIAASTNGSERLRIDSSGNLFIGGSSNISPLTLNKAVYLQSATNNDILGYNLYVADGANARRAAMFLDDANGLFGWDVTASSGVPSYVWRTATTERMRIDGNNGNVGIGTSSPSAKLSVSDATEAKINLLIGAVERAFINYNESTASMRIDSDALIAFATNNTERMRITDNGNVLINTAAIATTATNGFLYVPGCAGTPTGVPTAYTGRVPIVVDTTNNKLYFYSGGAWRDAGP